MSTTTLDPMIRAALERCRELGVSQDYVTLLERQAWSAGEIESFLALWLSKRLDAGEFASVEGRLAYIRNVISGRITRAREALPF